MKEPTNQELADFYGVKSRTVQNYKNGRGHDKNGNPKATPKQNEQKKRLYWAMLAFYRNDMRKETV